MADITIEDCPRCKGIKIVETFVSETRRYITIVCPRCLGTGKRPPHGKVWCTRCKGKGSVPNYKMTSPIGEEYCMACAGTGITYDRGER